MVNHVNAALVRDGGKCLTHRLSLFARSPDSVKYLAMCSIIDSPVSPPNLVYLGIFQPLGFSIYTIYSANGEEYGGLYSGVFIPFLAIIFSIIVVRLFSIAAFSC